MKTIAATLVALALVAGAAEARPTSGYFGDLGQTAPRSVFDDIKDSAPRSVFDDLRDTAPRTVFDDLKDSAPRSSDGASTPLDLNGE